MQSFLMTLQVVISVLLCITVLTQQRGTGLSATFGGSGGFHTSKRGAEKFLSTATVVLVVLFIGNSLLFIFV